MDQATRFLYFLLAALLYGKHEAYGSQRPDSLRSNPRMELAASQPLKLVSFVWLVKQPYLLTWGIMRILSLSSEKIR
jgi:hypothetical protein